MDYFERRETQDGDRVAQLFLIDPQFFSQYPILMGRFESGKIMRKLWSFVIS
jgi:hypothetical protein